MGIGRGGGGKSQMLLWQNNSSGEAFAGKFWSGQNSLISIPFTGPHYKPQYSLWAVNLTKYLKYYRYIQHATFNLLSLLQHLCSWIFPSVNDFIA